MAYFLTFGGGIVLAETNPSGGAVPVLYMPDSPPVVCHVVGDPRLHYIHSGEPPMHRRKLRVILKPRSKLRLFCFGFVHIHDVVVRDAKNRPKNSPSRNAWENWYPGGKIKTGWVFRRNNDGGGEVLGGRNFRRLPCEVGVRSAVEGDWSQQKEVSPISISENPHPPSGPKEYYVKHA